MAKKIEIFTGGTYLCEEVTQQVKAIVCNNCEVIMYSLNTEKATQEAKEKAQDYEIQSVPSIVVDEKPEKLSLIKKQMEAMQRSRQAIEK
ncbi:uncharacterized Zn finger protein (UPF0148 family) [Sporosarcina luteola]|nr:uncharacterized Zn finger protein (UPF0148 family) [Sporosarcina luteola]